MKSVKLHKILSYAKLMRMHQPIGFFLLLWPCLMGVYAAGEGQPNLKIVIIFTLGVFIMRSAGCVINDILDRNFDGQVKRTQFRPLVTGQVSLFEALSIVFLLLSIAFMLVLMLNVSTLLSSLVGLSLVLIYPLMKRVIHIPQLVLGAAFAWSIPMAYLALEKNLNIETFYLYLATVLWVFAYDTQYAMADRPDDKKIGVKSSALFFGNLDRLMIFGLQLSSLLVFFLLGLSLHLKYIYFSGMLMALCFVLYQQYLIKDRQPQKCFQAFLNNNYLGAILCLGLILDYINSLYYL